MPIETEQTRPTYRPAETSAHAAQPDQTPPAKATPAPRRIPAARRRNRLIVALFVAILIGALVLIARLARNTAPASVSPAGTPSQSSGPVVDELPALIANLDLALASEQEAATTSAEMDRLRGQIEAQTSPESPLRDALLTWLDAGQQSMAARLLLAASCAESSPDPDQCASLQTEYDLLSGRTRLARSVVCILADCPST